MKGLFKILLYLILLSFPVHSYGKFLTDRQPSYRGTIKIQDDKRSGIDTLQVIFHRPYTPSRTNYESIEVITDKQGNFSFKLPEYPELSVMSIWIQHRGIGNKEMARRRYFFESGDDIKIDIIKDVDGISCSIKFSGKGAAKYNIVSKLEKLGSPARNDTELRDGLNKLKMDNFINYENKINRANDLVDSLIRMKSDLIRNSGMSTRMQKIITYEYAPIYSDWKFMMYFYYTVLFKDNQKIRSIIRGNLINGRTKYSYKYDQLMALCPFYLVFLANEESQYLVINKQQKIVKFEELYNIFKNKYSGIVRERFIANLFLGFTGCTSEMEMKEGIIDSLMKDGEKYIITPYVKDIYAAQVKLSKGNEVFNGSFKDLNGKEISLSSLRGKVVFIDMWFTGCGACANFHQEFHKRCYPLLKDYKDFVYLSISLDKELTKWQNSVNDGKYTSSDYFNVNTGDLGFNHPFPKYYSIGGAPFLLLINKKGKIYSNIINSPESALSMIKGALDEPFFSR